MTTPDPTFPGFEPEAAEINEAHEIWGTPKPYTATPTVHEHLATLYNAAELTRAEYRDALKALYASEPDPQQLAKIRVQFVRVSIPAVTAL